MGIFENAGFEVKKYPYFSKEKFDVDFDAMYDFIATLPSQSIILLHPCCHNPTGADLSPEQWDRLTALLKEKGHIPFLDIAYQGMGKGFDEDAYAIRKMEAEGLSFIVSQSFSKIFSLYGERVGTLSVVCANKEEAKTVHSQLNGTIRKVYSNPPTFGATLIDIVLKDEELTKLWLSELEEMRARIQDMRSSLANEMKSLGIEEKEYSYITKQSGMFSFTNFSKETIIQLRENKGIYMVENGRICIAGLTKKNIPTVAAALKEAILIESSALV
ncbi:MAG: aromatic amino acid aminotransferase [Pseudopedobacter saltans]|uniref:Aminotransferase n=1 Tax=Pseudopedobacter saltans TaxID=151895 RepID=A0A2W5E8R7_9SPHI|nr:MAG: aromatic amino acid aminotransferase [Pseudopedobacter saltans]